MLWYKSWLETRWRFLIGLVLIACSAAGVVFTWPTMMKLLPLVPNVEVSGEIGRRIKESAEVAREYRGYIWSQWFSQNLTNMGTLFAVLLGTGGLLSQAPGATLFTLSLPIPRKRLFAVRALAGLGEFMALVFVPTLLIPVLSPAVGKSYSLADCMIHGACLFIAGAVFFSLALLLSTVFSDIWLPLLVALAVAVGLGLCEQVFRGMSVYGIFGVMSGEVYFRNGHLPWPGLLASLAASVAMLYGAATNLARRDF
jgi:hypothetical protein